MNPTFRPHGSFGIRVEARLLITEVTGPWNRELVDHWVTHCLEPARALSAEGPYVGITIIRESMLCPPDALEALRKVAMYSTTRLGCLAHVIVADRSVEGRNFLESTFARIFEGVAEHQIFYELEPALAWSRAYLAQQES